MGLRYTKFFILAIVFCSACSTTSWVVQDDAMDPNEFEKIKSSYFLESTNPISPAQPVVEFELKAINTYKIATRVKTERYIQRYRPRLSYLLLGLAGTGLSYYAAFSEDLVQEPTTEQKYALIGAGTLLTGLSFINMKPIGEPVKTGEARLLRKTGEVTEIDTSNAFPYDNETQPLISIRHNGEILVQQNEWDFSGTSVKINLADELNATMFSGNQNERIFVEVQYDTLSAQREVKVSDFYEQFAIVQSQITALRSAPDSNPDNILTDLARGSQLKLIGTDNGWFKVLYGISETYVASKDVDVIWRPSEFASDLSVITIPNLPFGSVDVEQNIPVIGRSQINSSAFIISNYDYSDDFEERIYGSRDTQLMEEYFIQAFGIRESRIIKAINLNSDLQSERAYSRLASSIEPGQSLTVYLSGYAEVIESQIYLAGSGDNSNRQYINLNSLLTALGRLKLSSLIIFADLDFLNGTDDSSVLKKAADEVLQQNSNSAIIFSSKPGQRSRIYSSSGGKKTRHSIFTYFLADGIKKGNTTINRLFYHLDRNVVYTSRSIYDQPQNPVVFGNRELPLVN